MAGNAPTVLVSSTCYDLAQVRRDLQQFIEEQLGYRALLSEHSSFPIDPDVDTIENCRRRVEQDADILVLIIGGRYGYVDRDTAKSITNLEYLAARAKGIPIYGFIDKRVLPLVAVWQAKPRSKAIPGVDSPRVLEFIHQVRAEHRLWTMEFESAQEIIAGLRQQFAHLMQEGLNWRNHLNNSRIPPEIRTLSGKAFRIAIEQPKCWDLLLLAQIIQDGVAQQAHLRRAYDSGIALGAGDHVELRNSLGWLQHKINHMARVTVTLRQFVGKDFKSAIEGDVSDIIYLANNITSAYSEILEWAQSLTRAHLNPLFDDIKALLYQSVRHNLDQLEAMGPEIERGVRSMVENAPAKHVWEFSFMITGAPEIEAEFERLPPVVRQKILDLLSR